LPVEHVRLGSVPSQAAYPHRFEALAGRKCHVAVVQVGLEGTVCIARR
jgi:hypothetical protein